jgi:hypothetical protein
MQWAMLVVTLAVMPPLPESIHPVHEPCREEAPESLYDKPSCTDYALNSELIASARAGDPSALQLLENRYWLTEQYQERHRIARVLLRRVADDSAIWSEIFANAQLAVRFADVENDVFAQWCDEHDCYWLLHPPLLHDAFRVAASDPRSHELLWKAIAVEDRDIMLTAAFALCEHSKK